MRTVGLAIVCSVAFAAGFIAAARDGWPFRRRRDR
jgi:hypothetical protein